MHAHPQSTTSNSSSQEHTATANFSVIKRDGSLMPFTKQKISTAINKAIQAADTSFANAQAQKVANDIATNLSQRLKQSSHSGKINIEDIQDQVELALMRQGLQKVARAYVLYREQRAQERADAAFHATPVEDGDHSWAHDLVHQACNELDDVDASAVINAAQKNFYQGISRAEVYTTLTMTARAMIEAEPYYSFVAARILLARLGEEVGHQLQLRESDQQALNFNYAAAFESAIKQGVERELLDPRLLDFDLVQLGQALQSQRDLQFQYLGLQTLYDRYFLHWRQQRLEMPQVFFMRVAMGLSLNEDRPSERAIEFYQLLSSFDYMASTPTLFNAGTTRPQLSSCYLTTVPDDLEGIYGAVKDNALLSKWAGGLGNDWTPVRALGSRIKGTNGESQGVVPFLKVVNDTAVAVNQGGKRKGAVCAYLETWHLDIEDFLDLRKNTGDERRRTHDMNTANWVPDLFMQRVFEEANWTLFSPDDVTDLHDLSGQAFVERYQNYEQLALQGELGLFKQVSATELWRKMLTMLFETGHPWITFKDPCNIRSPQQHVGVVHSSNLCTEITLNTNQDEIAVCNLGSINLAQHITNGELDTERLKHTVHTAVRMLDNVIDINYYACPQAQNSNLKHRPVGLGLMGFQDALYQLGLPYASEDAVYFADHSMEQISYFAIQASNALAQERGVYASYDGSLWSRGVLPIDSLRLLEQQRGAHYCTLNHEQHLDWSSLREQITVSGMRNSNVMAIAPTATISNIVGVSQSIEPTYQNLYVKSNLSGEFSVVNRYLVNELKQTGLWSPSVVNDLKFYDGSVNALQGLPEDIKAVFSQAFEIDSHWLIEAAARRQKWIDQALSLNLYMAEPSGKQLDSLYKTAWSRGLKTTYYLRSLGATQMEKSMDESATSQNADQPEHLQLPNDEVKAPMACSILEPDCEACQ